MKELYRKSPHFRANKYILTTDDRRILYEIIIEISRTSQFKFEDKTFLANYIFKPEIFLSFFFNVLKITFIKEKWKKSTNGYFISFNCINLVPDSFNICTKLSFFLKKHYG